MKRLKSKTVRIGSVRVGGNNPVAVQSMCCTDTRNVAATVTQIQALEKVGCEIIRVAVPDMEAAKALGKIRAQISLPLVADIHFDYRLALESVRQGVDKLRINPGNIGDQTKVKVVVMACQEKGLPIRIGVNGGSIPIHILKKHQGKVTAEGMVQAATEHIRILERLKFRQIVVSLKASDVERTVEANRLFRARFDYPLHLGVTEAGTPWAGTIKSAVGIGTLLAEGIGETIRVSLTGEVTEEVRVGWEILKSVGLRQRGPTLISCPTCGRTEIDLIGLAQKVEVALKEIEAPLKVAVMGCVVNGPGEAREADVGLAGGKGAGVLFTKGQVVKSVPEDKMFTELMKLVKKVAQER